MKKSFLVGVTQRIDVVPEYGECRDAIDQRLIDWLINLGIVPIPIPNSLIDFDKDSSLNNQTILLNWLNAIGIKGIVLSGGNNIGEMVNRDKTEEFILNWAKEFEIPVLGICRGMQMMGVWGGSMLYEVSGHVKTRHTLSITPNAGEWPKSVNSYHNLALKDYPSGFEVLARAEDDVLEAIGHKTLPWEGWMWHPERESSFCDEDNKRAIDLFKLY